MLTTEGLRNILIKIFKIDEEFVVPMDSNWYVPAFDKEKIKAKTYIGYRILSKRASNDGMVRCRFRISFVGKSAEEFSDQVLFWANDLSVKDLFNEQNVKLTNTAEVLTYPIRSEDENVLCFFVDFDAESVNANATTLEIEIASKIEDYIQNFVNDEAILTARDIEDWQFAAQ